jgi:hypothetical protein
MDMTDLPRVTTNSEAEYVALIAAQVNLCRWIERARKDPHTCTAAAYADPQSLGDRLTRNWQIKAPMHGLRWKEAATSVRSFGCAIFRVRSPRLRPQQAWSRCGVTRSSAGSAISRWAWSPVPLFAELGSFFLQRCIPRAINRSLSARKPTKR